MNEKSLRREIGLGGAIMMGLGSIIGTGVFVSIGVAAGVAGPNVLLAIFLASLVAICNGLSSAQLAANHPVSGGTYEYGYRWLFPTAGFVAGWLFVCAKSASAATAALGLAGYLQSIFSAYGKTVLILLALGILVLLTIVVLLGIKRTNLANLVIVGVTLIGLTIFVLFAMPTALQNRSETMSGFLVFTDGSWREVLYGTALMFVAYTGYGRIATLGEEVKQPRIIIPRAMIATLVISMLLYVVVGFVAVATVGAEQLSNATKTSIAPLLFVTEQLNQPFVQGILFIAAITAMLGVMLNLLLGLSRVVLAMSRRADLPTGFSTINSTGIPVRATLLVVIIIAGLVLLGDVKLSWSFSAITVLVYYAITNLCAIRLSKEERLYPVWPSWCGLFACLGLVVWIEPWVIAAGAGVVAIGLLLRMVFRRFGRPATDQDYK